MKLTAITFSILIVSQASVFSGIGDDGKWTASTQGNGIETFLGPKSSSGIRPTKASMVLNCRPDRILEVIYGIDHYTEWVPKCAEASRIESKLDGNIYFYQVYAAPFIKDRDLITRVETRQIAGTTQVILSSEPYIERSFSDKVRIKHFKAIYTITELANGHTKVELQSEIDMEGIPSFLLNWANESQPFETFSRLREQVLNN